MAWSPDDTFIASASDDGTIQVWNAYEMTTYFTAQGAWGPLAWSADGSFIASAFADHTIKIWDAKNGNVIFTYHDQNEAINALAWSPDQKYIASASGLTTQIWNPFDGSPVFTHQEQDTIDALVWSPGGKYIASASGLSTQIWNALDGKNVTGFQGSTGSVSWSPHGRYITLGASYSIYNTIEGWDVLKGTRIFMYQGHKNIVTDVAWSPDGQSIASASVDTMARVWKTPEQTWKN